MNLQGVRRFNVRAPVVVETEQALQAAGTEGFELFVLWTGCLTDASMVLTNAHIPRQQSFRGEAGLHVEVLADALHDLNVWLYKNQQVLAVQVHSHPGAAYHSDTDNTFPIVTALGGLSLVVPEFCRSGLRLETTVAYRLGQQGWVELAHGEFASLVVFET